MFEFRLPDLGEGIHEGELLQWHVDRGDNVKEDDPLCEMETDKAAVTIPSPRTGKISALKASPGDTIVVGSVFVVIDDGSTAPDQDPARAPALEPSNSGEKNALAVEEGRGPLGVASGSAAGNSVIAAPATRRLAREMGIDISRVRGTGPGGRIVPEDLGIRGRAGREPEASGPLTGPLVSDSTARGKGGTEASMPGGENPAFLGVPFLSLESLEGYIPEGPVEKIKVRSLRKKVAVKTTSSSILIPHVAVMEEIDVTEVENLRAVYNEKEESPGKLTLLAFVIKACASLLKSHPGFNASLDSNAGEILLKKYYNIGFAADTPRGLMVPVIRDADRQTLAGIGHRIRFLAEKARQGVIEVEELGGGTFSITNVGAIGGTHVFPIINAPESAILGMGRVDKKPVVLQGLEGEDEVKIRKILPATLCFDHRIIDGAQASEFVRELKSMLEDPLVFMSRI